MVSHEIDDAPVLNSTAQIIMAMRKPAVKAAGFA
jgi:hypothetical protein